MNKQSRISRVLAVTSLLIGAVVGVAGPASAGTASATPAWSVVPTPTPSGNFSFTLNGLACASTTSCVAVGGGRRCQISSFVPVRRFQCSSVSFAEHWNGTSWSIMPSRLTALGVSCPSTTSCFAVGRQGVEHWDGTSWSIMPSPGAVYYNELSAVSCPSTTSCFAVGYKSVASGVKTFVEHWNGTRWSIMPSPNGAGAENRLSGVSCSSTTSCFAVGNLGPSAGGFANKSLVERWNGTTWSIMPSPTPTGADIVDLRGVSCPSTTSCFAVGRYRSGWSGDLMLVEHWNGTSWSIVASPNPTGTFGFELLGVSCPSTTSCFAVGYKTVATGDKTFVERWNGTRWSMMASPNGAAGAENTLSGVSCSSTTRCFAVGRSGSATLVERYS